MDGKMISRIGKCALAVAIGANFRFSVPASAHDFPSQPVRIVVQSPAGNGPDITARFLAERLSEIWQQNVIVLNKPGGGGLLAAQEMARAAPDGYTLYMPNSSTFLVLPHLHEGAPIDLKRDLTPVGFVGEGAMLLAVSPRLGVNSVAELIAKAKTRPGKIFHAALSVGTVPHLTGELFKKRAGIDMIYVPHNSSSRILQEIAIGELDVVFDGSQALANAIETGTVKVIATTGAARNAQFPDVPAISETLPGFSASSWFPLLAPARTPGATVEKVNADLATALAQTKLQERFRSVGLTVRIMSPAETESFIRNEQRAWQPVVQEADLKSR